jgi:hypothetical protein
MTPSETGNPRFDLREDHGFAERLTRLERENRRLKLYAGIAVLALAGLALIGPTPGSNENRAERFLLSDAAGKTRASLGMTAEGPELSFLDENNRSRTTIGATSDGARFRLFDAQGRVRTRLSAGQKGTELSFLDSTGIARAGLVVTGGPSGTPMLDLRDRTGRVRAQIEVEQDGPVLRFYGDAGKLGARLRVVQTDGPQLTLFDAAGKQRGTFAADEDGWPRLTLWDGVNSRASLHLKAEGPSLVLADEPVQRMTTLAVSATAMGLTLTSGGRDRDELIQLVEQRYQGDPETSRHCVLRMYKSRDPGHTARALLDVAPNGDGLFTLRNSSNKIVFEKF